MAKNIVPRFFVGGEGEGVEGGVLRLHFRERSGVESGVLALQKLQSF